MNAPDRTGQVWKDSDERLVVIVRKPRITRWGDDVGLHDSLCLDNGRICPIVEFDERPLELSSMTRIA